MPLSHVEQTTKADVGSHVTPEETIYRRSVTMAPLTISHLSTGWMAHRTMPLDGLALTGTLSPCARPHDLAAPRSACEPMPTGVGLAAKSGNDMMAAKPRSLLAHPSTAAGVIAAAAAAAVKAKAEGGYRSSVFG